MKPLAGFWNDARMRYPNRGTGWRPALRTLAQLGGVVAVGLVVGAAVHYAPAGLARSALLLTLVVTGLRMARRRGRR